MLVLSRKLGESILIDGDIRITVVGIRGSQVRLGIEAPDRVRIFREELCEGADGEKGPECAAASAPRASNESRRNGPAPARVTAVSPAARCV